MPVEKRTGLVEQNMAAFSRTLYRFGQNAGWSSAIVRTRIIVGESLIGKPVMRCCFFEYATSGVASADAIFVVSADAASLTWRMVPVPRSATTVVRELEGMDEKREICQVTSAVYGGCF